MPTPRRAYDNTAYIKARAKLKARTKRESLPCWLCGQPIDTTLPKGDPRSFSADHVVEVGRGGAADGELKPSHLGCNSARGGSFARAREAERRKTRRVLREEKHPSRLD